MATLSFYANNQHSIPKDKSLIYYGFNTLGTFGFDLKKTTNTITSYDYKICFTVNDKDYLKAFNVIRMAIFLEYDCMNIDDCISFTAKIATAAGLKAPKDISITSHPMEYLIELYSLNKNTMPHQYDDQMYRSYVA